MEKVPDHVVIEIIIRAGVSEWVQIACVNKHWASLFRTQSFWQASLSHFYPFSDPSTTWPGPIPPGLPKRRFMALHISEHIFASDPEIQVDEIVGHSYLFLKEQLQLSTMPPHSGILHGTMIDQFIACGKSREVAHELASRIWLAVLDNLEENHHTFFLLKRLAQEGDNELEYGAEESPMSPRQSIQQQNSHTAMQANFGASIPSNAFGTTVVGQGIRTGQTDQQAKNSVFSNALSSPIRRSLQPYHLAQGSCPSSNVMSSGNGTRNGEMTYPSGQNRDTNSSNSSDCMDMHADSPGHDFSY